MRHFHDPGVQVIANVVNVKLGCFDHSIGDEVGRVHEAIVFDVAEDGFSHGNVLRGSVQVIHISVLDVDLVVLLDCFCDGQADVECIDAVDIWENGDLKTDFVICTVNRDLILFTRNFKQLMCANDRLDLITHLVFNIIVDATKSQKVECSSAFGPDIEAKLNLLLCFDIF